MSFKPAFYNIKNYLNVKRFNNDFILIYISNFIIFTFLIKLIMQMQNNNQLLNNS